MEDIRSAVPLINLFSAIKEAYYQNYVVEVTLVDGRMFEQR